MLKKILQRFTALVKADKKPDLGYVGIDNNWYTTDINNEWICYECAGGENEPPEPVYIEDIEKAFEQIKKEQEEEDKINDAEYELIDDVETKNK